MANFGMKHNKMEEKTSFDWTSRTDVCYDCSMHFYEIMKHACFPPINCQTGTKYLLNNCNDIPAMNYDTV